MDSKMEMNNLFELLQDSLLFPRRLYFKKRISFRFLFVISNSMKKAILLLIIFSSTSCATNYPTTTFWVKNTTNKTLNFKASIIKFTSSGPFEMTLPFAVPPNDSIVARKVGLKKDAAPTNWFTKFIIFPSDSIQFNDPNNSSNWIKSTDEKGRTVFTFIMTK